MMNPAELVNIERLESQLWWYRGMREITFALLDPLVKGTAPRILDAGAGTGFFAQLLSQRYGAVVVAVDLERRAVHSCWRRHRIPSVQASVVALPLREATFDVVVLLDVLGHLLPGHELVALSESHRVLRVGGQLLLRVPALNVLRSRHSEFIWEKQRFTSRRLRQLLIQAGFVPLRLTYANSLLSPIALFKFRVWEPLTRAQPRSGLMLLPWPLESVFYAALKFESSLIQKGINLPFGQSLFAVSCKCR